MSYTVFFDLNNPNTEYVSVASIQKGLRQRAFRYNTLEDLRASLSKPFCKDDKIRYGGKQFDWDAYFEAA